MFAVFIRFNLKLQIPKRGKTDTRNYRVSYLAVRRWWMRFIV